MVLKTNMRIIYITDLVISIKVHKQSAIADRNLTHTPIALSTTTYITIYMTTIIRMQRLVKRYRIQIEMITLTLFAAILRLFELERRVFHHDEAAVGHFTYRLFTEGVYSYNPAFHGPFLYYTTSSIYSILGDTIFSSRLLPAIFGVLMVPLVFLLRDRLGRRGTIIAAFFFAISPSFLYYSRFFRNDIFVAFFMLAAIICILKYSDQKRLFFVAGAGIFIGLSAAAKENTYIYIAIFTSYLILTYLIDLLSRILKKHPIEDPLQPLKTIKKEYQGIITILTSFLVVYALFYTDFFSNPQGFTRSFESAITHWYNMHTRERVGGPPYFYIPILLLYELPIVLFAAIGSLQTLKRPDRFKRFLLYWTLTSLAAYSYLGEKVPWLTIHILLPMILLASTTLNERLQEDQKNNPRTREILIAVFITTTLLLTLASLQLNYQNYTNPAEPLIQAAQPPQRFQEMLNKIDEVADQWEKYNTTIQVTDTAIETQLLWYLRDYRNIKWRVSLDSELNAPLIIAHDRDAPKIQKKLENHYQRLDSAKMNWYRFKTSDITPEYILWREMTRPPDEYGIVLFYRYPAE